MQSSFADIASFLTSLGLERYIDTFQSHEIDLDVLGHLTVDDLRELELPIGVRRKILTAIDSPSRDTATPRDPEGGETGGPERRQLTIMFCDMVGSTELSTRLDPEDLREVMRIFIDRCARAAKRYGGYVAQTQGDGILVYFGYPQANEDDAQRALFAALSCQETVTGQPATVGKTVQVDMQVRIGVHTGLVVVGDVGGVDSRIDHTIVGEAPNIASRMQSVAAPNEIVASSETRGLVGGRFVFETLPRQKLKGVEQPVDCHRLVGETPGATRFEAHAGKILTPLVGRTDDYGFLKARWEQSCAGEGQAIVLAGAAGIGKSRIINTLVDATASQSRSIMNYQCSPHHTATSLHPVVTRLYQLLGQGVSTPAHAKAVALKTILRSADTPGSKNLALIAKLMSIDDEAEIGSIDMSPQQQKEETLIALVDEIRAMAADDPLLVLFEDIHWADPTTLELLSMIADSISDQRAMLVATCRPDTEFQDVDVPNAVRFTLSRLTKSQADELVRHVASPAVLPQVAIDAITQRADGVPLFVEELTKTLIESEDMRNAERMSGDLLAAAVPLSLMDSLSARLDALKSAKQLAQIASCIGREFSSDLLYKVSGYPKGKFESDLGELLESGLVYRRENAPQTMLVFNHALVQDVAYRLLLNKTRSGIHEQIVTVLEGGYAPIVGQQPEMLARHCEAANLGFKAVQYLIKAGDDAIARSANSEALTHLRHGLDIIGQAPDMDDVERLELNIQSKIGIPLIAVEGYTSQMTGRAFERARELGEHLGDINNRFRALYGLWGYRWMGGEHNLSHRLASDLLAIAGDNGTPEHAIIAHRCMGSTNWITGNFRHARRNFEAVLELTAGMDTLSLAKNYAACPRVAALVLGANGRWFEGETGEAWEDVIHGTDAAVELGHPYSIAFAHCVAASLAWLKEDYEALEKHAGIAKSVSTERRFPYWSFYSDALVGSMNVRTGNSEDGIALISGAIEAHDRMGVRIQRSMQLSLLADAEMRTGNRDRAQQLLSEAHAFGSESGELQWFSVIHKQMSDLGVEPPGQ